VILIQVSFLIMGRKKSTAVVKPGFRPFCFYCDRDFDNEKVLIQHQKLKHFQCYICHRKSDTARGLVGHMLQVHKESMPKVPNSIVGREDPELAIHGLEGVPNHLVASRAKGTLYEDELARRRALENASFSCDTVTSFHHMVAPVGPPPTFASHFPFPPPTSGTPRVTASGMLVQPQHFSFPGIIPPPPPLQPRSHPTLTDTKDGEKSNQGATSKYVT